jgi:hypothetical protein
MAMMLSDDSLMLARKSKTRYRTPKAMSLRHAHASELATPTALGASSAVTGEEGDGHLNVNARALPGAPGEPERPTSGGVSVGRGQHHTLTVEAGASASPIDRNR